MTDNPDDDGERPTVRPVAPNEGDRQLPTVRPAGPLDLKDPASSMKPLLAGVGTGVALYLVAYLVAQFTGNPEGMYSVYVSLVWIILSSLVSVVLVLIGVILAAILNTRLFGVGLLLSVGIGLVVGNGVCLAVLRFT